MLGGVRCRLVTPATATPLNYAYILRQADGSQIHDWGRGRRSFPLSFPCAELLVWMRGIIAGYFANVFYTEPFKKVLLAENFTEVSSRPPAATHTFRVKAPLLARGQTLCLLGEGAALGN